NGNGNANANGQEVGHSGKAIGHANQGSHITGNGRGTALTAPGSLRRSDNATARLSIQKNATPSGVTPGLVLVGVVPPRGHAGQKVLLSGARLALLLQPHVVEAREGHLLVEALDGGLHRAEPEQ